MEKIILAVFLIVLGGCFSEETKQAKLTVNLWQGVDDFGYIEIITDAELDNEKISSTGIENSNKKLRSKLYDKK